MSLMTDDEFVKIIHSVLVSFSKHLEIVRNMCAKLMTITPNHPEYFIHRSIFIANIHACQMISSQGPYYDTQHSAPFLENFFFSKIPNLIHVPTFITNYVYEMIDVYCANLKNSIHFYANELKPVENALRTEIKELIPSTLAVISDIYMTCFYGNKFTETIQGFLHYDHDKYMPLITVTLNQEKGTKHVFLSDIKVTSELKLLYVDIVDVNVLSQAISESGVIFPSGFNQFYVNRNMKYNNWPRALSSVTCIYCADKQNKLVLVYALHDNLGFKKYVWLPKHDYLFIDDFDY